MSIKIRQWAIRFQSSSKIGKSLVKWWNEKPNTSGHQKYESIYELFVSNVFFDSYEDTKLAITGGIFGDKIDCKAFLETYFNIEL